MSGIARERRKEIETREAIRGTGVEFRIIPESEVKDVKKGRG
jgi:hypothetical protein